jgi:hypothetical protein
MSDRAREFIDHWESENVEAVADPDTAKEAERLASLCRQDALRAGIAVRDLEDAVGGDLIGSMLQALEAAALRKLER